MSAPTGFLLGAPRTEEDRFWTRMYGSSAAFLADVTERGVTAVEVRDARDVQDPADVAAAIRTVKGAGLEVTVHLWLPDRSADLPDTFASVAEALRSPRREPDDASHAGRARRAPSAGRARDRVACAVHGHDRLAYPSVAAATEATVSDLRGLCDRLAGGPLLPAFELCRVKPDAPIGTGFDELLSIADLVDRENLGFCWDMGHGLDNHVRRGHALVGPDAFLERVAHTHIHDLDDRGKTHGPLRADSAQVAEMVRALRSSGYEGIYDLELEPTRWPDGPECSRRLVARSVETLAALLV